MKKLLCLLFVLVMLVPSNAVFADEEPPIEGILGPAIVRYIDDLSVETCVINYVEGEYFDRKSITVTAHIVTEASDGYYDETYEIINYYYLDVDNIPLTKDITEITVSVPGPGAEDIICKFPIHVVAKEDVQPSPLLVETTDDIIELPDDGFVIAENTAPTITYAKRIIKRNKKSSNTIKLKFEAVPNAKNYEIYICKNKKFNKNTTIYFLDTNDVTLTLKNNGTYYIKVRALLDNNEYSDWSNIKKVKKK